MRRNADRGIGSHLITAFLVYLLGGFPVLVFALPQEGQVVAGDGSIQQTTPQDMVIHQNTDRMILDWQGFSIGASESVQFVQPGAGSVALNRVIGGDPSLLLGRLSANGQVFLSNPSGVIFGPGARVDAHGLIATTLKISDADFLAGQYHFHQDPDQPLAALINEGHIQVSGYAGLLAPAVDNRGTIVADLGSVAMASGTAATLDFTGDGLIQFAVTGEVDGTVVDAEGNEVPDRVGNSGLIQANGGRVILTARDAGAVIRNVVNQTGVIEAQTVVDKEGRIFLSGGDRGVVRVSGTLEASGKEAGETGGTVRVLGHKVGLFQEARVDVSGDAGGGTALIGGDFQGGGRLPTAVRTFVGDASVIEASAGRSGDGGKVIVWADDLTRYSGSIRAAGGSASGDGGFVEVSGKQKLDFRGAVDVAAAHGTGGTLLLDPTDIVLSTAADSNTTGFTAGTDNTEAFAEDSGQTSTFDVSSGGSFSGVSSGSTILLQATNDITVSSLFDLTTATGNSGVSLELNAKNHIDVNAPLKTDGAGTLTLVADSDTSGTGTLTLGSGGGLVTQSGTITLKGADFVMSSPAAGDIQTDSGTLILAPLMSTTVGLGAQTGTFGLSNAEIAAMTVSDLIVGDAAVNATLTADDLDVGSKNLTLKTAGAILDADTGPDNIVTTGNLVLTSGSGIGTMSSVVNINAPVVTVTGSGGNDVYLSNASTAATSHYTLTTGGGGTVSLVEAFSDVDLDKLVTSGSVSVDANTGKITSDSLTIGGNAFFTTQTSGQIIDLTTSTTGIAGQAKFTTSGSTGHVTLDNGTGPIRLDSASSIGGDLSFISSGNQTLSDAVSLSGSSALNVTVNNGSLTVNASLDTADGNLNLSADDQVTLMAAGDLSTASGDLTVKSANQGIQMNSGARASITTSGNALFDSPGDITLAEVSIPGTLTVKSLDALVTNNGTVAATGGIAFTARDATFNAAWSTSGDFTANATDPLTLTGADAGKISARTLIVNTPFNVTLENVSSGQSSGLTNGLVIHSGGTITVQNGPVTFNAMDMDAFGDIRVNEDVTTSGNFFAKADADADGAGTFQLASTATVTSTSANIYIEAAEIFPDGTLSAAGTIDLVEGTVQSQVDQGTTSTFLTEFFEATTEGGC